MAHTGTHFTTTSSTSSLQPFPLLSPSLLDRLNTILNLVHPTAHSWSDLTQARQEAQQQAQGGAGGQGSGASGGEEDDEVYNLLLRLTWQDGTTWHSKWENALASSGQSLPSGAAGRTSKRKETERPPPHPHRTHRPKRPSDDLSFLRKKLNAVDLSQPNPSTTPRRPPSTPAAAAVDPPRPSTSSRLPPPARPKSTPPIATPRPARALLVPRGEQGHGYSSADEWAGVPRAAAAAVVAARRASGGRTAAAGKEEEDVTPRRPAMTRKDGAPNTSTPTAAPRTSHPLLDARLAELSSSHRPPHPHPHPHTTPTPAALPSHPLSHLPTRQTLHHPPPVNANDDPAALSDPPSTTFLISGQFSPPEASALALSFSRLRTIGSVFDTWLARTEWVREREREVEGRRGEWEGRCALLTWRGRLKAMKEAEQRANEWRKERDSEPAKKKRLLRSALGRWREKRASREGEREEERRVGEKREREARLRGARDRVVELRRRGVLRRGMEHWYLLLLHHRATHFRTHTLLRHSFSHLLTSFHSRLARAAELSATAEERWAANEAARARSAFGEWRRRAEVRGREREWVRSREREGKLRVWEGWRDKLQHSRYIRDLEAAADQHYAVSLASSSLETWKRRKRRVDDLSSLALSTSTSFLRARLSSTHLPHWRLCTRLSLSLSSSRTSLLRRSLTRWVDKYEHVQVELAGRADAFSARKDAELAAAVFGAWADAASHHARLVQAACAVSARNALSQSLGKWSKRYKEQQLQGRKADVVRAFMLQRGAWRVWVERGAERRRGRWVEGKKRERGREALLFWLQQTRQKQQDRLLVQTLQARSDKRLLASSVSRWRDRLSLHREIERAADEVYEGRVVQAGFRRWADQTVKAAERLVFADEHRALKLEENLLRSFHHWRRLTTRSLTLKDRLSSFLAAKEVKEKEEAFGTWRERFLAGREKEVREKRERAVRGDVVQRWMGKSKARLLLRLLPPFSPSLPKVLISSADHDLQSLLAHRHYSSLLLSRSFSLWRSWTPPVELVATAIEVDRNVVLGGAVKVWRIRGEARRAVRGVSRLRPFGSSPSSSPTVAAPRHSSPAASPSSSLALPSSAQATPTPALPRSRPPLTRPSLPSTASPSPAAAPNSSLSASSLSASHFQSRSLYYSTSSAASPSTLLTTPSASTSPSTAAAPSSSSRPRLSAEFASIPSLHTRPPSRSRLRSASISSRRSVQTSRSAPAGTAVADTDDDDDEDEEAHRRDETPSRGPPLSLSRSRPSFASTTTPRQAQARTGTARSEGGETSSSRGEGGGGARAGRQELMARHGALIEQIRDAAKRVRTERR